MKKKSDQKNPRERFWSSMSGKEYSTATELETAEGFLPERKSVNIKKKGK